MAVDTLELAKQAGLQIPDTLPDDPLELAQMAGLQVPQMEPQLDAPMEQVTVMDPNDPRFGQAVPIAEQFGQPPREAEPAGIDFGTIGAAPPMALGQSLKAKTAAEWLQVMPFVGGYFKGGQAKQLGKDVEFLRRRDESDPEEWEQWRGDKVAKEMGYKAGKWSAHDANRRLQAAEQIQIREERGQSIPADIAEGLIQMAPYMIEMATVPGGGGGGSLLVRGARTVARGVVGATTGLSGRTYARYQERRLGKLDFTDKGQAVLKNSQGPAEAFFKAYGATIIAVTSELAGEAIATGLGKVAGKIPIVKTVWDQLAGKLDDVARAAGKKEGLAGTLFRGVSKATRAGKYDGLIGEIGEERLEDVLNAVFGTEEFGLQGDKNTVFNRLVASIPRGRDLLVELGVLSVPGAIKGGLGLAAAREPRPPASPGEIADVPPTRTGFKKAGLPKMGQSERESVVEAAKAQVAAEQAQGQGVADTSEAQAVAPAPPAVPEPPTAQEPPTGEIAPVAEKPLEVSQIEAGKGVIRDIQQPDIARAAKNLMEGGSQRVGDIDWTVDGDTVLVQHHVTGRDYGTIDLKTGQLAPVRATDYHSLQLVDEAMRAEAKKFVARQELDRLMHYPGRNKKQIDAILAERPELATDAAGRAIDTPHPLAPKPALRAKAKAKKAKLRAKGKAEVSPETMQQVLKDWNNGDLYVDNNENWHVRKPTPSNRQTLTALGMSKPPTGPIAPYNKELKRAGITSDILQAESRKAEPAPAKKPEAAKPAAKEPWQMGSDAFVQLAEETADIRYFGTGKVPGLPSGKESSGSRQVEGRRAEQIHKEAVENAIHAGKDVPVEVAAEYGWKPHPKTRVIPEGHSRFYKVARFGDTRKKPKPKAPRKPLERKPVKPKKPAPPTPEAATPKFGSKESADAARARLKAKAERAKRGPKLGERGAAEIYGVEDIKDLAAIGAYHVAQGVKDFKAWSGKMVAELGEAVRPHLDTIWEDVGPKEGRIFGISNARVDAELERLGLEPAEHGARIKFRQKAEQAAEQMAGDQFAGQTLARALQKAPRPVTADEHALLMHEEVRLANERTSAEDAVNNLGEDADDTAQLEASARRDRAIEDFAAIGEVLARGGRLGAQSMAIRRLRMKDDFSLASMERTIRATNKGKRLTEPQLAEIKALHEKLAATEKALDEKVKKSAKRQKERARKPKRGLFKRRYGARNKLVSIAQFEKAKIRLREKMVHLNVGIDPAMMADMVQVGIFHLEAGARDAGDWAARMVEDLGDKIKPHLKNIAAEANRQLGEQKKTAMTARVNKARRTYMRNRMVDFGRRIAVHDYEIKKREPLPTEPETMALKYKYEQAKEEYADLKLRYEIANATPGQKVGRFLGNLMRLPMALKASLDLSATLRQGAIFTMGRPITTGKMVAAEIKSFRSKERQFAVEDEIKNRPNYGLAVKAGIEFTEIGEKISKREEMFQTRWAEKIPGIAGSDRAFTTGLNKLRMDVFDTLLGAFPRWLGQTREMSQDELKLLGNAINVGTGRGPLGRARAFVQGLNWFAWAARLNVTRIQTIIGQPIWTGKVPWKGTGKMRAFLAWQLYGRWLTGVATVYGLASLYNAFGDDDEEKATIETDSRSTDFGKIRIGDTRVDPLAGMGQVIVLGSRVIAGKKKTGGGKVVALRGEDVPYRSDTTYDIMARFLRQKANPAVGTAIDVAVGENVVGEKATPGFVALNLVTPLAMQDIYEAMLANGVPQTVALSMLTILGMGVQTYSTNRTSKRGRLRPKRPTRRKRPTLRKRPTRQ